MFRKVTHELSEIRHAVLLLEQAVRIASERLHDGPLGTDMADRIASLEGAIEAVAGVVDAGLTQMEAKGAAAKAAEERARGHMKRGARALEAAKSLEDGEEPDPFEERAREYGKLYSGNADDSEVGEVSGVHPSVEAGLSGLDAVRAAKRGVG